MSTMIIFALKKCIYLCIYIYTCNSALQNDNKSFSEKISENNIVE
jgi:hypothetical protein